MEVERVRELPRAIGRVLQRPDAVDRGHPVPRIAVDAHAHVRGLGAGGQRRLVERGSNVAETRPVSVRGDLDDGPVVVVQGRQAEPAALGQPVHRQQVGVLIGRVEEAELGGRGVILLEVERRLDVVACDHSVRIRDDDAREGNGDREGQDDQRDRADASAGRGRDRGIVELDDPAAAFAAGATADVRGPGDAHDHAEQADRQGEGS